MSKLKFFRGALPLTGLSSPPGPVGQLYTQCFGPENMLIKCRFDLDYHYYDYYINNIERRQTHIEAYDYWSDYGVDMTGINVGVKCRK